MIFLISIYSLKLKCVHSTTLPSAFGKITRPMLAEKGIHVLHLDYFPSLSILQQWTPTILAPRTSLEEDNFSMDWMGNGTRMIQVHTFIVSFIVHQGFPGGSDGKESACSVGDLGSMPGLGRSSGGGHGNPLQYACLENPHGQKFLPGCSPWGHKESDMTED